MRRPALLLLWIRQSPDIIKGDIMRNRLSAASALAFLLLPMAVIAEGSYLKAGVGQSRYSVEGFSENKTGWLLAYGAALDPTWGIEGGYVNLGRLDGLEDDFGNPRSLRSQAVYAAGTGRYALNEQASLFAKLGLAVKRFSGEGESETRTSLMGGVGAALRFDRHWGAALEYTHYGKSDGLASSMTTLAATYSF